MIYIVAVLGIVIAVSAVFALYTGKILSAIIASGAVSLVASLIYILAGAPDVAMTEASIGSALTTVVFLIAWRRISRITASSTDKEDKNA
ncbi:Na(+)/H(+) antiporter subunit B [Spirochaeta isovalerica]|uniref:Putative MnhB-related membrane protein n=1 Tax=Spirochaeta isovalerica TaxID=150 RepID=A0A841R8R5_9SPIO|nr:hydrogenase subunit MbhD domain-containing protein [Spirochaeta isovalerica]MBB6480295.1 putative MnhB-related membrane protein [Spirochaeta isovalerica]